MSAPPKGLGLYRALLRLLPGDMRRRFGHDMTALLADRLAQAATTRQRARIWAAALADLLVQSVRMRLVESELAPAPSALLIDLRHAAAGLRASPGVTAASIVTLGIGVGASAAVFSVADAVLRADYPVEEPERLVFVWAEVNGNKAMALLAESEMSTLQLVSGLSAWTLTLTGEGEPREVTGLLVAPEYFELLGVRPILGRGFRAGEDLPGAGAVVVLSHGFWVTAFGADPDVVGRVIRLSGAEHESREVIGVMPPGVERIWQDADVWVPLEGDRAAGLADDNSWYVNDRIARLAPGASLEEANAQVRAYAARIQTALPRTFSVEDAEAATVRRMSDALTASVRTPILVTLGAVVLVLVIGRVNVANLLLARSDRRHRDLAVRGELGAGRARMVRLLLLESTVVAACGGALGIVLAGALVAGLHRLAPPDFPGIDAVAVDGTVLAWALLATAAAGLVSGLAPAVRASAVRALSLVSGSTRGSGRNTIGRLTTVLVGGQVGLAVVVTLASGLMLRSFDRLMSVDPGLDATDVLAFKANPNQGDYPDGEAERAFFRAVSERLGSLPSVESIGGIHLLPGTRDNWSFPTFPEGFAVPEGAPTPSVNFRAVRDDYFETVGLRVVSGRTVGNADQQDTESVVVVNEAFVRDFWPGADPLGRTLSIFSPSGRAYRVVGVVADVHQHGRELAPRPEMYFSHGQLLWDHVGMWLLARVRPGTDVATIGPAVRDIVWSIDPDVPVSEMLLLADVVGQSTRGARFLTALLTGFGALALGLCALGVFGVTAYVTGRRAGEFGVRVALGSSRARIVRSAVARAFAPVAVGLGLGLVAARLASGVMDGVLYEVDPADPATFASVALLLGAVGLLAAVVPAWRASGVDPVRVLGSD